MANGSADMVEFQSNGGTAIGYLAKPPGDGPFPGVIVIQEWWGLNDHIKVVADRFAAEGFVTLAPDLYGGRVAREPDEARKLAMSLELPHAITDMLGAVNYLCGRSDVSRIGAIGFCMGGSLVLHLATKTPRIAAVASFYGGRIPEDAELRQISSPVLAFYGGRDQGIPPEKVDENRAALERANVPHDVVVYDHADHAFFNDSRPTAYDAAAASDSWQRTLMLFRKHLQTT